MKIHWFTRVSLLLGVSCLCACSNKVDNGSLSVTVAPDGEIASIEYQGTQFRDVAGDVTLDGYEVLDVLVDRQADTVRVSKTLADSMGRTAQVVESIYPTESSVRWTCEVIGDADPCSVPIRLGMSVHTADSAGFWTTWGRPGIRLEEIADEGFRNELKLMNAPTNNWLDPLVPIPFTDTIYYYGAPAVTPEAPRIGYCPLSGDIISVPVAVAIDRERGVGISLVQALDDYIQDMTLETTRDGRMVFTRLNHRLVETNPIRFSCDIVGHGANWRESLAWICNRYPEFFEPENPLAQTMGGAAAYTNHDVDFDVEKMKRMAFRVNWRASFDFPYMGMFLPPVDRNEEWTRFGGSKTSQAGMADYAARMKEMGFCVLNYFNVTEFGARVSEQVPPRSTAQGEEWKNSDDYLYGVLRPAILRVPDSMNVQGTIYSKVRNGGMFYTWEDGVVMDCGVPVYADFLLEQTDRHLQQIPDAYGFCIDRMDWLRMFNLDRDDGRSWFNDQPAGSLILSWHSFMDRFAEKVHGAGKVIFVNNHTKRIDLLRHADGILDEFTNYESALNATAFLVLKKPFLGWTPSVGDLQVDGPDNFFQKYLYMGAFPMCPFPGNDHSIRPDEWGDRQYLDYGPLMKQLEGRQWVLSATPVEVVADNAKANVFEVPDGYVVPVVYARDSTVGVDLGVLNGGGEWSVEAWHPGKDMPQSLPGVRNAAGETPRIEVPVVRGCAVLHIRKNS